MNMCSETKQFYRRTQLAFSGKFRKKTDVKLRFWFFAAGCRFILQNVAIVLQTASRYERFRDTSMHKKEGYGLIQIFTEQIRISPTKLWRVCLPINDEVLRRGRTERKLMNRIRAGQMSFLGHIMRKHGLENIVVIGKIEGERSRGRPRLNFMKSLSQLLKISEVEIIERTRNREEWRTMTANVRIGYGT